MSSTCCRSDSGTSAMLPVSVRRISAFVVGCLAVGISYMVNAFNIYALALKSTFDLSQTKLELLAAMLFLGLVASLPGGLILDTLGARWAAFVAGVVSVSGYLLIWWACTYPQACNFATLIVFFLIAGTGGGLTYIAGTAANVRNFGDRVRGTVVGVIHAALSAGPAAIMLAYNSFFAGDTPEDPSTHNLPAFFTFVIITFGIINFLGIILYDHYPPDEDTESLKVDAHENNTNTPPTSIRVPPPHRFANNYDPFHASSVDTSAVHSNEYQVSEGGVNAFVEHTRAQSSTEPNRIYELSSDVAQAADTHFEHEPDVPRSPQLNLPSHLFQDGSHSPSLARSLLFRSHSRLHRDSPNLELSFSQEATRSLARSLVASTRGAHKTSISALSDVYNTSVGPLVASKKLVQESQLAFSTAESQQSKQCHVPQVLTLDFKLLFWPCVILMSLQMMFIQNLTSVLESVDQEQYIYLFPYITPILGTFAKPIIGLGSDASIKWIPRSVFIIAGCALDVLVWMLSVFFIDRISVILISTTVCDFAAYMIYSLGPPLLIERFGMANFSRNWSLVMAAFAVSTGCLLLIFGAVYDSQCAPDAVLCYGLGCFRTTFFLSTILSVGATVSIIFFYLRHRSDLQVIDD